jgi:OOP family OmpA-OmpF porin
MCVKMMAEADKAKLQKIAPTAYNDALQSLNDADAYIGQNPMRRKRSARKPPMRSSWRDG